MIPRWRHGRRRRIPGGKRPEQTKPADSRSLLRSLSLVSAWVDIPPQRRETGPVRRVWLPTSQNDSSRAWWCSSPCRWSASSSSGTWRSCR